MRQFILGLLLATAISTGAAAQTASQCVTNAVAGGTVDAITVPLLPCGLSTNILILTIAGANATTTPTLQMAGFPAQRIYTNTLANPGIGDFGTAGSVLMLTSTGSSWLVINGNVGGFIPIPLSVANGGTGDATLTANGLLYGAGTSPVGITAAGQTGQYLRGTTGNPPNWQSLSSDVVTTLAFGTTGLTPAAATSGAITVAGTLIVGNGGTGAATFTNHGLLLGQATSAFAATAVGATGQYLKGVTGADPAWATLASDTVSSINFGTTGLTPAGATAGAVTVAGTLATANGGTGQTSYTNGQLLIGNTGTGSLSKATLTAGTNVTVTNSAGGITISSTGLASGCGTGGSLGNVLTDNGSGGCTSNTDITFTSGTIALGINTSEAGAVKLFGATSGNLTLKSAAVAGASTVLTFPGGTTDFSATGGTNQLVKQASAGGAFTVGTIACAGLSDGATGCSTTVGTAATQNTGTSGATIPLLNADNTWSGTQTFNGTSGKLALKLLNGAEPATISATVATGTINYDICTQSIIYYTSNASANWTVNFRCSSGTTLNTAMATGDVVTVTFLVTQGGTAFYNNVVTVDSGANTPKYQGGTAWSAGNINSVDAYTYAITKTANATFTVFASQTQFK